MFLELLRFNEMFYWIVQIIEHALGAKGISDSIIKPTNDLSAGSSLKYIAEILSRERPLDAWLNLLLAEPPRAATTPITRIAMRATEDVLDHGCATLSVREASLEPGLDEEEIH